MARTTQQVRDLYEPPCTVNRRPGALDAWIAFDAVLEFHKYAARVNDTAFRSCRQITGGDNWSLHAYYIDGEIKFWNWRRDGLTVVRGIGVALDLNWQSNPYGKTLVTDMTREMVTDLLAIRTNGGHQIFWWGGYYSGNKDAMHYEIKASPAELALGIDPRTVRRSTTSPPPVVIDQWDGFEVPILLGG